ncbi:TPR-like protein [Phlegmacium glaucopus]|nr:TPR-like protein [Phlegmacium glaucopus]
MSNPQDMAAAKGTLALLELANKLRIEGFRKPSDLDAAVGLYYKVITGLPASNQNFGVALNELADALVKRFQEGGQVDDLDEAISLCKQAIKLQPSPNPMFLNNLSHALWARSTQRGHRSDLNESIDLGRQALELLPSSHSRWLAVLSNLASGLRTRFTRGGQRSDLDEAIALDRLALKLKPQSDTSLNNLALAQALSTRFKKKKQRSDLDEAISLYKQVIKLLPSPDLGSLNNLANELCTRFVQGGGQRSDIDEAIDLHRQTLELFHSPYPDRPSCLINFSVALHIRFEHRSQKSDLDEAISLCRQALELRPSPHPHRPSSLSALGHVLVSAHSSTDGNSHFLEEAMSLFSAAIHYLSQSPSQRLSTARCWILHAVKHQHISAIDAYEAALQALPRLAALSFDLQSRHEALTSGSDGLARDASICAIQTGNLVKAIEFLEAGRSIFWSQSLSLRSPFDRLHEIKPQLACTLRDIATALEVDSHRGMPAGIPDDRRKLSLDQQASRLNHLDEEWGNVIDEVRTLKGFEDFLRLDCFSSLHKAASAYPVVFLVSNDKGSHCLILTSTSMHHIDIPSLPTSGLQDLVRLVQAATPPMTVSGSSIETIMENVTALLGDTRGLRLRDNELQSSDDVFKFVLRILWNEVVKPVISFLKIEKSYSGELPVLQWCPTGAFTFLPIHAAGCYDIEVSSECASDYFISSYIPTIGLLLTPDSAPGPSTENFKMMVVMPSTETELESIIRHVSSDALIKFGVLDVPAKVEAVASCLPNSSIIHFACHGKQDRFKPLDSGVELDDGLLRVSRIMKEKISNGSLAFLCSCDTAMGDENIPDEAMSLGASLLFSGFRRVIATMWEIRDQDGPVVADAFYEELFRGPDGNPALEPDITRSARALHAAVKKLRTKERFFPPLGSIYSHGQVKYVFQISVYYLFLGRDTKVLLSISSLNF